MLVGGTFVWQIVLLLAGLAMVLLGAEWLVDGSSSMARKWGISEFVIGMTIVAFGTSAPELVVSTISSFQGRADMAVGNIVGSDIFNTAFILGLSAIICPILVTRSNLKKDIPLNIIVVALLFVLGTVGARVLGRIDGAILLVLFCAYIWYSFKHDELTEEEIVSKTMKFPVALGLTALGLGALILGGQMFVGNAELVASELGLSDKFIGITVLALGTSLPELATSLVAASKGKSQLALGNILGSNIFNILLILGIAAVVNPLAMSGINAIDFSALLLCGLVVLAGAMIGKKRQLRVGTGVALLLVGTAYMAYLFVTL